MSQSDTVLSNATVLYATRYDIILGNSVCHSMIQYYIKVYDNDAGVLYIIMVLSWVFYK